MNKADLKLPVVITSNPFDGSNHGGARVVVDGRRYSIASVRSYEAYSLYLWNIPESQAIADRVRHSGKSISEYVLERLGEAEARARRLGYALYWVQPEPMVITAQQREREIAEWRDAPKLAVGDVFCFDGAWLQLVSERRELKLEEVQG